MNINDCVWVRLTKEGERRWAEEWQHINSGGVPEAIRKSQTEKDGFVKFQLWELMHIFGGAIHMGITSPFVDNEVQFQWERK